LDRKVLLSPIVEDIGPDGVIISENGKLAVEEAEILVVVGGRKGW